jgi:hypothetical protein
MRASELAYLKLFGRRLEIPSMVFLRFPAFFGCFFELASEQCSILNMVEWFRVAEATSSK